METLDKGFKEKGYNGLGGTDPRTPSAKGIAQASQESVNELNGLMHTSVMVQERISNVVEGVGFDRFADIGEKVAGELQLSNEKIEDYTKATSEVLGDIKREGLNMKR